MRHWAAILLMATFTLTAGATVRVFVTDFAAGYSMAHPEYAFTPSFSSVDAFGYDLNAYDCYYGWFAVSSYPPINCPSGTQENPVSVVGSHPVYIWLQFQAEPNGVKIDHLTVTITDLAHPNADVTTCYYVLNDMGGNIPRKRWEGPVTQPGVPEFRNNPQTLAASSAYGIRNGRTDYDMLFRSQSGTDPRTGVTLLGAAAGPLGLWAGCFSIAINEISYGNGPDPTIGAPAYFGDIPEPTTLLLLAVGGALIRRR